MSEAQQIVKKLKPTSPGCRHQVRVKTPGLSKKGPVGSLLAPKMRTGGRNNQGRLTVRHRGGGHKKQYRIIDWKRNDKENKIKIKTKTDQFII